MNHGTGYNQALGPTNYSGTPIIKNLLIKDVALTKVRKKRNPGGAVSPVHGKE